MNSYKIESQYKNCPVYQTTINGVTRYGRLSDEYYINITSCCGKLKAVHQKCAIIFLSKIDSTYIFDTSTYEGEKNKIIMHEMQCKMVPL